MSPSASQVSAASTKTRKRLRSLLSCTECHRRKQKCNRLLPCNDCTLRGVAYKCEYQASKGVKGVTVMLGENAIGPASRRSLVTGPNVNCNQESIEDLAATETFQDVAEPATSVLGGVSNIPNDTQDIIGNYAGASYLRARRIRSSPLPFNLLGGIHPFPVFPDTPSPPSTMKQPLIHHFRAHLAPWLSVYEDHLSSTAPRLSWLPEALHHTALFQATLLASAVHLARMQRSTDLRMAMWYKGETIRLVTEGLASPAVGATDEMLLVVLILAYFTIGECGAQEYETHLAGINRMLGVRGGLGNLGLKGKVKNWLLICYGPWIPGYKGNLIKDY